MGTIQTDPIIAELRAVRDEHAARFMYEVPAIFQDIKSMQKESGRVFVRYPPRKVSVKFADGRN